MDVKLLELIFRFPASKKPRRPNRLLSVGAVRWAFHRVSDGL